MEENNEIYSKVVRAGKRTYFFDVKSTKGEELFVTLTESKKIVDSNGNETYKKSKVFLFPEDFEKFQDGLEDVLQRLNELNKTNPTASHKVPSSLE